MNKLDKRYRIVHGKQTDGNLLGFGVLTSIIRQLSRGCTNGKAYIFDLTIFCYDKFILENSVITWSLFCKKPKCQSINLEKDIAFYMKSERENIYWILTFWRQIKIAFFSQNFIQPCLAQTGAKKFAHFVVIRPFSIIIYIKLRFQRYQTRLYLNLFPLWPNFTLSTSTIMNIARRQILMVNFSHFLKNTHLKNILSFFFHKGGWRGTIAAETREYCGHFEVWLDKSIIFARFPPCGRYFAQTNITNPDRKTHRQV